jgi:DNA integrity scanning protein DisA with diadenylate cyclase activity
MSDFLRTRFGQQLFERLVPQAIATLDRIAAAMDRIAAALERMASEADVALADTVNRPLT